MEKRSGELGRIECKEQKRRRVGSPSETTPRALAITVVFTTVPETLRALKRAGQLASELHGSIRILVPWVVPYPLALEQPPVEPDFGLRHFRTRCQAEAIATWIDVRLCRAASACIESSMMPHAVVLIGGGSSWWPFTPAHRLRRKLSRLGHEVILV